MRLVILGIVAVGVIVVAVGVFGQRDSVRALPSDVATAPLGGDYRAEEPNPERALFLEISQAWQAAQREAGVVMKDSRLPVGPTRLKATSKMDEEAKRRAGKAFAEIARDYGVTSDELKNIYRRGMDEGWAAESSVGRDETDPPVRREGG